MQTPKEPPRMLDQGGGDIEEAKGGALGREVPKIQRPFAGSMEWRETPRGDEPKLAPEGN